MVSKTPNPIDKHVGRRVRVRRMLMGMSQEKLGEALDLSFQQVQKYEKGTNRIGASRLQEISKILNVPVDYFFEAAPVAESHGAGFAEAPAAHYVSDFMLTSQGVQLMKAFLAIKDQKVRKHLVDLIATLASKEDDSFDISDASALSA